MRPIPNLATASKPAAFVFGYMHGHTSQDGIVRRYWPEGSGAKLDPVGPSPLLIHLDQLRRVTPRYLNFSFGLRSNSDAERVMQGIPTRTRARARARSTSKPSPTPGAGAPRRARRGPARRVPPTSARARCLRGDDARNDGATTTQQRRAVIGLHAPCIFFGAAEGSCELSG